MYDKTLNYVTLIALIPYVYFCAQYLAPDSATIMEYGFVGGIFHGVNWWITFAMKLLGNELLFMATNRSSTYVIGFIIGCLLSYYLIKLIFISLLMPFRSSRRRR